MSTAPNGLLPDYLPICDPLRDDGRYAASSCRLHTSAPLADVSFADSHALSVPVCTVSDNAGIHTVDYLFLYFRV